MICYVLAMGKQHLGPHVIVGYGIKIFSPGLFITSPDHLERKSCIVVPISMHTCASVSIIMVLRSKIECYHVSEAKSSFSGHSAF